MRSLHKLYKVFRLFILSTICCLPKLANAQVENVIVETYYVSDSNDATDITGGTLDSGSVTYRVYVDLKKGTKLRKIYGDSLHNLKFLSTANFFNNIDRGQTFGKDISKSRLSENTNALDTWLTIGQACKNGAYFGVLKSQDSTSFIGGINNDGGSAGISSGLLINNDPKAGAPLTSSDGYELATNIPTTWSDFGFKNLAGDDSSIFGSLVPGNQFIGQNVSLQNN